MNIDEEAVEMDLHGKEELIRRAMMHGRRSRELSCRC